MATQVTNFGRGTTVSTLTAEKRRAYDIVTQSTKVNHPGAETAANGLPSEGYLDQFAAYGLQNDPMILTEEDKTALRAFRNHANNSEPAWWKPSIKPVPLNALLNTASDFILETYKGAEAKAVGELTRLLTKIRRDDPNYAQLWEMNYLLSCAAVDARNLASGQTMKMLGTCLSMEPEHLDIHGDTGVVIGMIEGHLDTMLSTTGGYAGDTKVETAGTTLQKRRWSLLSRTSGKVQSDGTVRTVGETTNAVEEKFRVMTARIAKLRQADATRKTASLGTNLPPPTTVSSTIVVPKPPPAPASRNAAPPTTQARPGASQVIAAARSGKTWKTAFSKYWPSTKMTPTKVALTASAVALTGLGLYSYCTSDPGSDVFSTIGDWVSSAWNGDEQTTDFDDFSGLAVPAFVVRTIV